VQREPPQVVVQAESGSPPDVLNIEPRIVINGQQMVEVQKDQVAIGNDAFE